MIHQEFFHQELSEDELQLEEQQRRKAAEEKGWLPLYDALRDLEQRAGEYETTEEYKEAVEKIFSDFIQDKPAVSPPAFESQSGEVA